jgi:hypothetical protein
MRLPFLRIISSGFFLIAFTSRLCTSGENDHNFLELVNKFKDVCDTINIVPTRFPWNDSHYANTTYGNTNRTYSMLNGSMHRLLNLTTDDKERNTTTQNVCETSNDIKELYSNFQNSPDDTTSLPCTLSWYSSASACDILQKYGHVSFNGDSLTKHLIQGLSMLTSENWRYWTIQPTDCCQCDGLFSEESTCRRRRDKGVEALGKTIGGIPIGCDAAGRGYNFSVLSGSPPTTLTCDQVLSDGRPLFYYLQIAVHKNNNPSAAIESYQQIFETIKTAFDGCLHLIRVVVSGATVCSETLERMYPFQHRSQALQFNIEVEKWLHHHHPHVVFLDPWNLSRASLNRSSDGFHFLTDYNIITATTLLNLMDRMVRFTV